MCFHETIEVAHGHRSTAAERTDDACLAVIPDRAPLHAHRQGEHSSVLPPGIVDESSLEVVNAKDGSHGHIHTVHHLESIDFARRK